MASISFCSTSVEAGTASSQSARSICVEKCSETKRTFRVVGRAGSETNTVSIPLCCDSSAFSFDPASSLPTRPTKMQRPPREAILRATLPAPPILVSLRWTAMTGAGASGEIRDTSPYTNSSSMRSPTHSTVRLEIACDKASKSNMLIRLVAASAEPVGGVEVVLHVKRYRLLQRREAAVIASSVQPIDLALGEVLVAAANRLGHVDILDIGLHAERGVGRHNQILEAARLAGPDIEEPGDGRRRQ